MNQIDYQSTQPSFNQALAFSAQGQNHNSGQAQAFFPRNTVGPQAFSTSSYPGLLKNQQQGGGDGFNFGASGANVNINGALTNSIPQQQQQQLTGQQFPLTNAAFSQPTTGPMGTASDGMITSPFNGNSPQSSVIGLRSPRGQGLSRQSPLAAVPNRMQASPRMFAAPQSQPHSPSSSIDNAREKDRLELLLDINNELLQEMDKLQAEGKGAAPTPAQVQLLKEQGLHAQTGSDEFVQIMSRMHANLGYLCGYADYSLKPGVKEMPHPPNYIRAPPAMPQLSEKYSKLRALFPGWSGIDGQMGTHTTSVNAGFSASDSPMLG